MGDEYLVSGFAGRSYWLILGEHTRPRGWRWPPRQAQASPVRQIEAGTPDNDTPATGVLPDSDSAELFDRPSVMGNGQSASFKS
jgi:hypothetical protein